MRWRPFPEPFPPRTSIMHPSAPKGHMSEGVYVSLHPIGLQASIPDTQCLVACAFAGIRVRDLRSCCEPSVTAMHLLFFNIFKCALGLGVGTEQSKHLRSEVRAPLTAAGLGKSVHVCVCRTRCAVVVASTHRAHQCRSPDKHACTTGTTETAETAETVVADEWLLDIHCDASAVCSAIARKAVGAKKHIEFCDKWTPPRWGSVHVKVPQGSQCRRCAHALCDSAGAAKRRGLCLVLIVGSGPRGKLTRVSSESHVGVAGGATLHGSAPAP